MSVILSQLLLLKIEFLDIKIYDEDFLELLVRAVFNLAIVYWIVRYSYLKGREFNSHVFSFFLFSVLIFFICFLMSNVKLDFGVAFGLFAIFSILRYRTDPIPIREMTYLFVVMGVSVINALSNKKVSYAELLFTNLAIVSFTYILERYGHFSAIVEAERRAEENQEQQVRLKKKRILYHGLDFIRPEDHPAFIAKLKEETGLDIRSINIRKINFEDETVLLRVTYEEPPDNS